MRSRARIIAGAAVALALLGAAGCSSSSSAGKTVQSAASALASQAAPAVSSALAQAGAAASSALAGAASALDVRSDVTTGPVQTASSGRSTSVVQVKNTSGSTADFTVVLTFRDDSGKVLDAVVMTIDKVPAGGTGSGTATSNRDLSGTVTVQVDSALRH
jgi:hypothetical protein